MACLAGKRQLGQGGWIRKQKDTASDTRRNQPIATIIEISGNPWTSEVSTAIRLGDVRHLAVVAFNLYTAVEPGLEVFGSDRHQLIAFGRRTNPNALGCRIACRRHYPSGAYL